MRPHPAARGAGAGDAVVVLDLRPVRLGPARRLRAPRPRPRPEALPAPPPRGPDLGAEERARVGRGVLEPGVGAARGAPRQRVPRVPAPAARRLRRRLRRPAPAHREGAPRPRRGARAVAPPLPPRPRRRVPGHQPRPVGARPAPRRGPPQPHGRRRQRSVRPRGHRDHDGRPLPPAGRVRRGRRRGALVLRERRLPAGPRRPGAPLARRRRGRDHPREWPHDRVDLRPRPLRRLRTRVDTAAARDVPHAEGRRRLPRRHVPYLHATARPSRCSVRCSGATRNTPTRCGSCPCTRRRRRRGSRNRSSRRRYGLPTLPFVARNGADAGDRRLVGNQQLLDRLFASLDTAAGAERLLSDTGLGADAPHHIPQSRTASAAGVVAADSRSSCAAIDGGARRCTGSRCSATTRKGAGRCSPWG